MEEAGFGRDGEPDGDDAGDACGDSSTGAELMSGEYESMYVALHVQVVVSDINKKLSDNVTVQTQDDERFVLYARQASTFGIDAVPLPERQLCGHCRNLHADGAYAVMPVHGV